LAQPQIGGQRERGNQLRQPQTGVAFARFHASKRRWLIGRVAA
jgi:hypothetical protein